MDAYGNFDNSGYTEMERNIWAFIKARAVLKGKKIPIDEAALVELIVNFGIETQYDYDFILNVLISLHTTIQNDLDKILITRAYKSIPEILDKIRKSQYKQKDSEYIKSLIYCIELHSKDHSKEILDEESLMNLLNLFYLIIRKQNAEILNGPDSILDFFSKGVLETDNLNDLIDLVKKHEDLEIQKFLRMFEK